MNGHGPKVAFPHNVVGRSLPMTISGLNQCPAIRHQRLRDTNMKRTELRPGTDGILESSIRMPRHPAAGAAEATRVLPGNPG